MSVQDLKLQRRREYLALFQGGFYLITGLWPLLDITSFMAVTGPKTDTWLVRTVGLLIASTGAVLIHAARKKEINPSLMWLAIFNAGSLAVVDVVFSLSDVISRIYLLDAFAEIIIVIGWLSLFRQRGTP